MIEEKRQNFNVVHVKKRSNKKFEQAMADFLEQLGKPEYSEIEKAVADQTADQVVKAMEGPSHFMLLGKIDMGAGIPSLVARNIRAVQFLIGNPLIADTMIRHDVSVALYVPLRVLLYEEKDGSVFVHDLPSSLLSQFGNSEIDKVGLYLDQLLENLIATTLN